MLPIGSVIATIVLLNVAAMEATPCGTFFAPCAWCRRVARPLLVLVQLPCV
jgi:hypothetical protein